MPSAIGIARLALVIGVAGSLFGCWTPPAASVRPAGRPRVIQRGIEVERVLDSARVESVNRLSRTVGLSAPGVPSAEYEVGQGVRNWREVRTGDRVRARIEEVLTLYVAPANERGGADVRARRRSPDARVLLADPSYRLLEVQYPHDGTEILKVGLHTSMRGVEAGDLVVIRHAEVTELRVRHPVGSRPVSRSRAGAVFAR
jgi:hypothetical protein